MPSPGSSAIITTLWTPTLVSPGTETGLAGTNESARDLVWLKVRQTATVSRQAVTPCYFVASTLLVRPNQHSNEIPLSSAHLVAPPAS
jgi:hypothetical protein